MVNPGEKVSGVACTDDKLIVDLEDGRTISVPLVWYPRLLSAAESPTRITSMPASSKIDAVIESYEVRQENF